MWYGRPQFAKETAGPFSRIVISADALIRRARVAAEAPPATPPTMTILKLAAESILVKTPDDERWAYDSSGRY